MFRYFWFSGKKPFLNNFLNLFFWFFILLGIFYFFRFGQAVHPVFSGIMAWLSALVLTLPHIIYQKSRLKEIYSLKFPLCLELLAFLSLILPWLGTFIFYRFGFGYDSFVNFNVSFICGFIAFLKINGLFLKIKKKKEKVVCFNFVDSDFWWRLK